MNDGIPNYNRIQSGEVSGSLSAKQCPSIIGELYYISAATDNAANIYIGGAGVTAPDGTTDTTTGMPLSPGKMIGPLTLNNLSLIYFIGTATTDDLIYLVLG